MAYRTVRVTTEQTLQWLTLELVLVPKILLLQSRHEPPVSTLPPSHELYASSGSLPDFFDDNHHGPMLQDGATTPPCMILCQGLCGAFCCILSCIKCCRRRHDHDDVRGDTTVASLAHRRRSDSVSRYKAGSGFCLVMFLTIFFLPTALLRVSSRSDSTWILHPGE